MPLRQTLDALEQRSRALAVLQDQTDDVHFFVSKARERGELDPFTAAQIVSFWGRYVSSMLDSLAAPIDGPNHTHDPRPTTLI